MALRLSLLAALGAVCAAQEEVRRLKFLTITSYDGTKLNADASLPLPKTPSDRFPVVIMANSWSVPQFEYVIQAQELAQAGYIILEYETRGWFFSGGEIDCAGEKDQRDISEVISYVLSQSDWQADPGRIALAGISYGAGLALLGAGRDPRVKVAVAMSGWSDLQQALFKHNSPNLVWGEVLVVMAHVVGKPEPLLDEVWRQVLAGNVTAAQSFATLRSVLPYLPALENRSVPLFISNNFEDRLFYPEDAVALYEQYKGPKRLLLNQGVHASAEIGGLFGLPNNHVWLEVKKWLATYLKGEPGPSPPAVEMQLRSNRAVREQFDVWPSSRLQRTTLVPSPRGRGFFGSLVPKGQEAPSTAFESISFGKMTGINGGLPVIGELMQVFVDHRITSNLLLSSRKHAIWFYKQVDTERLCGTPLLNLDMTPSHAKWQVVAYLLGVNRITKVGTLISHGSLTCWNCTAGQRGTYQITLRTLCEDLGGLGMGGIGLALNMYSALYEPANSEEALTMDFHYSENFSLEIPVAESKSPSILV
ncbi:hypothetical protein AK812_SmicGene30035 [Symbiodinium microadriaticum]|uniref:Xaa-Pro dipeptidyl-peptidase-like domain-containing protein n=1 Tax=Symbiodinium microadriaticum TaxID=2951 RepID=A0A1Q9D0D2_SYMMI|nr:hypothetical protein AK812_SmicGene30035 [Symbiodinium microadriaticum]